MPVAQLASFKLAPMANRGEPILKSDVGYHVRAGGHSLEPFDWNGSSISPTTT